MAFTSLQAQIASHESWAKTPDRATRTAPARKALMEKFEHLVDPDGIYPDHVRAQMAESARKAYFRRLALKSAKARSTK